MSDEEDEQEARVSLHQLEDLAHPIGREVVRVIVNSPTHAASLAVAVVALRMARNYLLHANEATPKVIAAADNLEFVTDQRYPPQ